MKELEKTLKALANKRRLAILKYLKENKGMAYYEIAQLLNRDDRTIWTAYKKAQDKHPQALEVKESEISIPISILNNRDYTILESTVIYLKEKGLSYAEIAKLLNRDQRNIWTIYAHAMNKSA